MQFRVLGCSGSDVPGRKLTSFLLEGRLLLDAGSATSSLTIDEQMGVTDVLVTHAHLDHVRDIPFLADNRIGRVLNDGLPPLRVWALPKVLDSIGKYLFNDTIWPDFTVLPSMARPAMTFLPLEPGVATEVAGLTVAAHPVNHASGAAGYAIWDKGDYGHVLFTGDTGVNDDWWEFLRGLPFTARNLVTEASFPSDMAELATVSKHLTPRMLREEIDRSGLPLKAYVSHLKAMFVSRILEDLERDMAGLEYHVLTDGEVLHL